MPAFICEYGNRHEVAKSCTCYDRYKVLPPVFRHAYAQIYGKWVEEDYRGKKRTVLNVPCYPSDLTDDMRNKILLYCDGQIPKTAYENLESRNLV